jgi:hypothetical protein
MNWISQNYKWLFDGVLGTAVVALAGWLFRRNWSRSKSRGINVNPMIIRAAPPSRLQTFHPDPAPENIFKRIDKAHDLWELSGYIERIVSGGSGIVLRDVKFIYLGPKTEEGHPK